MRFSDWTSFLLYAGVGPRVHGSLAYQSTYVFLDLEKAFDCVPRDILWEVLRCLLLRAVQSGYEQNRSLVRITSSKSDMFPVHVGLQRGCPSSLVLFIIFYGQNF